MSRVLEVNDEGALVIPADLLNGAAPHQRFTAESAGNNLVLMPESAPNVDADPFWRTATPEEWAKRFREWADSPRPEAPSLSDESLRRENIYE